MKKKLAIIGSVVVVAALAIPSGVVLAKHGIDGFDAYLEALEYGLLGLERYFEFIVDLFRIVLGG